MWTSELRRQHRHITTHWQGPQPCSLAPESQADAYASFRIHHGLLRDPIAVFPAGKLPTHSSTRVRKVLAERLPSAPLVEVDPADYRRSS
jgi:hypothetical protein